MNHKWLTCCQGDKFRKKQETMLQPTNGRYYSRRRGLTFSLQSPSLYKKTQNKGHTRVPQKGCRKQSINTPPEHRECISRYIISDTKTNLKSTWLPSRGCSLPSPRTGADTASGGMSGRHITQTSQMRKDKPPSN